jgi:Nucleotidyl transferase AbiEii toxin, Type IV TA system
MESKLHYNSTSHQLLGILETLMAAKEFNAFRLVGGTALSLLRGHRESNDIDLFSDAPYDSIYFGTIIVLINILRKKFKC